MDAAMFVTTVAKEMCRRADQAYAHQEMDRGHAIHRAIDVLEWVYYDLINKQINRVAKEKGE
jgi:hypothetical protein